MGATTRWKSENKTDNKYAYAYYGNFSIAIIFGIFAIYHVYAEKYILASTFSIGFIWFFMIKNLFADFSNKTNCKTPHTLQEFLAAINIERPSKVMKLMRGLAEDDYGGIFVIAFLIAAGTGFAMAVNNEAPSIVYKCLWIGLVLFSFPISFALNAKILSELLLLNEKVTHDIMRKVESVRFHREEDKEKFSNAVIERIGTGYITRNQLFEITSRYVFENDRTDMVSFLKDFKSEKGDK